MKKLLSVEKIVSNRNEIISLFDLEIGVKSIGDFVFKVEDLAEQKFPNAQYDEGEMDKLNTFKGDMLEVFAEIFFYIFSAHPEVGITNYTPVPLAEDYGVDAVGINVNGDNCVAQIKYRANPVALIDYGDLTKTLAAGYCLNNFSFRKDDTIFLLTTGQDTNSHGHHVLGKILRVINRQIIAGKVDNNQNFWQQAEELIMDTLDSLQEPCQYF
jgi:hypothetical protein